MDDALDVFACRGIGGIWGTIATGLFASSLVNPSGPNGLLFGNPSLVLIQAFGVAMVAVFGFVGSYAILRAIVRVSPEEEHDGLDISQHGEEAYE